jgi:hypothetical protein
MHLANAGLFTPCLRHVGTQVNGPCVQNIIMLEIVAYAVAVS